MPGIHISQPGRADSPHQGAQEPGQCPSGDFGSGYAGLDCYIQKSFTFGKIFSP